MAMTSAKRLLLPNAALLLQAVTTTRGLPLQTETVLQRVRPVGHELSQRLHWRQTAGQGHFSRERAPDRGRIRAGFPVDGAHHAREAVADTRGTSRILHEKHFRAVRDLAREQPSAILVPVAVLLAASRSYQGGAPPAETAAHVVDVAPGTALVYRRF